MSQVRKKGRVGDIRRVLLCLWNNGATNQYPTDHPYSILFSVEPEKGYPVLHRRDSGLRMCLNIESPIVWEVSHDRLRRFLRLIRTPQCKCKRPQLPVMDTRRIESADSSRPRLSVGRCGNAALGARRGCNLVCDLRFILLRLLLHSRNLVVPTLLVAGISSAHCRNVICRRCLW